MAVKASYVILSVLLAAVIANAIFIGGTTNELYGIAAREDGELGERLSELKSLFERRELFLSLSVSHEDLRDIEEMIAEMEGAIEAGDEGAAKMAESRLKNALRHLGRLSSLNFESVF